MKTKRIIYWFHSFKFRVTNFITSFTDLNFNLEVSQLNKLCNSVAQQSPCFIYIPCIEILMRNMCLIGDGTGLSNSITEFICKKNVLVSRNVTLIIITYPYNGKCLV
jgi:hypothetical protein